MNTQVTRRDLLAGAALLAGSALVGCGGARNESKQTSASETSESTAAPTDKQDEVATTEPATDEQPTASDGSNRILVAYFSRADENYAGGNKEWLEVGHTKVMAGYIVDALGADEYEIVPKQAYPEGYDDCCDVALEEQGSDARPAIANALPDVSGYDVVFVGCPIWWGDEPMIIRTFLDGVDLSGKTVVPFTTHGGSGLGNVPANLQGSVSSATFLDGHAVAGTAVDGARDEVTSWAKGLGVA